VRLRIHFPAILLLVLAGPPLRAESPEELFRAGAAAYQKADYTRAAHAFSEASRLRPSAGALQNLGNAESQLGLSGAAILAWERSLWLDPYHKASKENLKFERHRAQLESPDLSWYEVISTWLPVNAWPWITGGSFWLSMAMVMFPGVFRWRRASWHQAVAAVALMVFLLSLPAQIGVYSRSRIGFILVKDTPLRLTPTREAQVITRLAAGDPVRLEKVEGPYVLVRTGKTYGWLEQNYLGLIVP
jgi:hypothetical protein